METISKVFVGVDVAKAKLQVHCHPTDKSLKFNNSPMGIKAMIRHLSQYHDVFVMCEASGGYERLLVSKLRTAGIKIVCIDPRQIKGFIQSRKVYHAKTDKIDAKMIALFASSYECSYDALVLSPEQEEIRDLNIRRDQLNRMLIAEKARLEKAQSKKVKQSIMKMIRSVEKEIERIYKQLTEMVEKSENMKNKKVLMETMPGVSGKTSLSLLASVPEIGLLTGKQISALVGVAPHTKQSGTWKGKAMIQGGRWIPRKALYMATLSAIRYNPALKEFYNRLVKSGKEPKVALVAVMRKMLVILNVMLIKEEVWRAV